MDILINGKRIQLHPRQAIAKGGEADIFDLGQGKALKLFKPPDHPDYQGLPKEQQAAIARIAEHQQKLPQFPTQVPSRVVKPEALAMDKTGQRIVGYVMPLIQQATVLLKYSDRTFRQAGISNSQVTAIFQDLHRTVVALHQAGLVIGDFNDLNVLVNDTAAYLIDADSFQFGPFLCNVFTAKFVDPLLCDYSQHHPMLVKPHSADSDWYAFAVMVMQCLLFVDPYGGIYKPKDPSQKIPHPARPSRRITVFHPEVVYPKPAIPYRVLSDDLLDYLQAVFTGDRRGLFPISLLETLQWQTCPSCGREHARRQCPDCAVPMVTVGTSLTPKLAQVGQGTIVRGSITMTRLFHTNGVILAAAMQEGKLRWLYHEAGQFRRDDGTIILTGNPDPHLQIGIQGNNTLLHKAGQLVCLTPGQDPVILAADRSAANSTHYYWIHNGQLLRNNPLGAMYVGDVLSEQTQFWVGDSFGFGFYRAGNLKVAFVFDSQRSGINDQVALPPWSGQLLHADCTFTSERCWLFMVTQEQGQLYHRCTVITATGEVEATAIAQVGDGSWLAKAMVGSRTSGHCATQKFLWVATDEGVMRVEIMPSSLGTTTLVPTKTFADTEPFIDASSQLFIGWEGLYVVTACEVLILTLGQ
ncbi:MAG: hypothetical protein NZ772_12385 [Cyanobacteria bacterium]|nr:hypothetical protein [Cyanobacteriota bacterium]MDW8200041.1 hypothetical protein [Cyanobacteriota bacterium SKYGB_h_bin112]